MCGIAGHAGPSAIPPERMSECLARMRRRGPDHQAFRAFPGPDGRRVELLASRLSIIDLDPRANQPFRAGTQTLVYNGELYNYLELRLELARAGVRFDTTSDTEVLVRAIDRWGWAALDRMEGMWALAVYDESDGSLTLARDRFGEKPLYLFREGEDLYFGSEPKFLAALRGRGFAPDLFQVRRYLVSGYKSLYKGERTFFEGVREVPPGTTLRVGQGGRESRVVYWKPAFDPDEEMEYEEAVRGTRERLIRSVEIRLRADVPLAFCLSGGVDSNAFAGVASRALGREVHAFTVTSGDPRYDESDAVAGAVRDMGIRHTTVPADTRDFLKDLRTIVRYHDAPVYTISYFAHWRLMAAIAAAGYRVSVSGTGADELFSGYYDHHLAYLAEVRTDPELHARSLEAWNRHIRPAVRNPYLSDPDLFVRDPGFRDHIYLDQAAFAACLAGGFRDPFSERHYSRSLLRNRMANELFHESVPPILHEDDANAMYFSVENRSPYLDRSLFEFCQRIPTQHLVRDGYAKAVLRDAVRGLAPECVLLNRVKVGFNASVLSFLSATDPAVRERVLSAGPIFEIVRRDCIEKLLGERELPNSRSKFLFYFLSARAFLDEFAAV
ncbi:MAG: asparagine synthase (glutamine-hydrolyzing) [Planctomycetes bacterium]|nr:asparagine synthase (glutamine-hydrolyzing) [Planctomycetota bacterium]